MLGGGLGSGRPRARSPAWATASGAGVDGVGAAGGSASTARSVATIWSAVVPNGNAPRSRPAASTRKTSAVWLIQ